jgi:hypothetical protein
MRVLSITITFALLASLAPFANAAPAEKSFEFTSGLNQGLPFAGTFALVAPGGASGTPVSLPANVPQTWVYATPLGANASFQGGSFAFDLYLTNPVGSVRVAFGDYEQDAVTHVWHFRPLKVSAPANVNAYQRSLVAGQGLPVLPGVPQSAYVGHATATITGVNGVLPKNSYPAIQVTSTNNNALYMQSGALGATSNSNVTIPMPELPALALLGVGALVVGSVVVLRTRKGSI